MLRNKLMQSVRIQISSEDKALMEDSFALADRIHFLLKKYGISQSQLAKKLNKRESEISKWLSGGHNFTQATLTKIGLAIGEKVYIFPNGGEETIPSVTRQITHLKSIISRIVLDHKANSMSFERFNDLSNLEVSSTGIICRNSDIPKPEFKQANLSPEAFAGIEKSIKL